MGNAQSASLAHPACISSEPETNGGPIVAIPNPSDATSNVQTPAENEENNISRQTAERPRSFMKFPSLRKRRRSIVKPGDEGLGSTPTEETIRPSPSRRRWRAFSGIKSRPSSAIAVVEATDDPLAEASGSSIQEINSKRKGKQPETQHDYAEPDGPTTAPSGLTPSLSGPSQSGGADLHEREQALQVYGSTDQVERPPTPIPASVIQSTCESERHGDDARIRSHTALAEALGSWMSGRQGDTPESTLDDGLVNSELNLPTADPPVLQRIPSSMVSVHDNSDLVSASRGDTGRATGAIGSMPPLSIPVLPEGAGGQNAGPTQQDRRTLPPAGTGTLVVVQGVVHTTDVRRNRAQSPSRYRAPVPTRLPRSTSSTSMLRAASSPSIPQSPTRASTLQSQSSPRGGRFSSLTSSLRPRSRPGTSLRRDGTVGWEHNPSGPSNLDTQGTASEHSNVLGLTSSASDSESTTASTSSTFAVGSRDGVSIRETSRRVSLSELVDNNIDGIPLRDSPRSQTEGEEIHPADNRRSGYGTGTDDGSEDENETELSAGSIEVLGTLLSVATAATAASLVTGTTDPLFSSGLTGSHNNVSQRNVPASTAGTSGADIVEPPTQEAEASTPSGSVDNNNSEAAVNTRMRAAWENLRDRFSRSRSRRGTATDGLVMDARQDPREQMLRDMARAFNTELGLDYTGEGSEGTVTPEASPLPNETITPDGSGRPEPESQNTETGPEGSFERFLHNLQVDLRTALTEDYAARRARAQARDTRAATHALHGAVARPFGSNAEALLLSSRSSERPNAPTPTLYDDRDASPIPSTPLPIPAVPNTPRPATLDLPSLPGETETLPANPGPGHTPAQAHGITGQPGAGINWWRLYRFPPMQLAPHPNTSVAAGVPILPTPPSPGIATTSQGGISGSPSQTSPSQTSPSTQEEFPNQNVVPVIVVGLQSVLVNRGGAHPDPHRHQRHTSPFNTQYPNDESDALHNPSGRERPWPLRAASRPFTRRNRRSDADFSPTNPSPDDGVSPSSDSTSSREPGGRTYLIFVIGGYYPPNHSIVTGADDMNSFEALWELAELLGQVKPPVASKEDIEKSGLEIIKASSLADYEQGGKVASNTVERCLICLDDYEHEDDLRLLSCRHIFHKHCVDKWLEQGRNNCPACRTKGVRTSDDSPPASPNVERP